MSEPSQTTRSSSIIFSANASPSVGGQGLNLEHVVAALQVKREAHVFCRAPFPNVPTSVVRPTVIDDLFPRVPYVRRLRDWGTLAADAAFDASVSVRLLRGRPHVSEAKSTIFHGAVGQCSLSLSIARRKGWATILDVVNTHVDELAHHVDVECQRFGVRSFIHAAMRERILAEYARANFIRVMSERARRTFAARGFDMSRVFVATPPIDFESFGQTTFSESLFRVIFVGLVDPWKGFHYLVEAFASLPQREAELVLWGGPGSRPVTQYLKKWMSIDKRIVVRPESVRKVGYSNVYGKASVLVHPSMTDGFGYVVAEAMASGVPVIVSENAGAADLVDDGVNGYIVPAGSVSAIADRLEHLSQHPAKVREMGHAARETVRSLTPEAFRAAYAPTLAKLE